MDEAQKKQLTDLFLKSEAAEAAEAQQRKQWAQTSEAFYQQFSTLAKQVIKPELQQAAEMFLQRNFPAAVFEAEHEIAIQIDRKGNKLEAVSQKGFPGVRLAFWANFQDSGFVLVRPGGLMAQDRMRETKVGLSDLTTPKILELLKAFIPQALEALRR